MKKLKTLYTIAFLAVSCNLWGQNLIPNGDFELGPDSSSAEWLWGMDISNCVYTVPVLGPDFWSVTQASPDRLIEGDICTVWDNDTAFSGNAYINIGTIGLNSYEGGKTILISPLQKDSLYRLTVFLDFQGACGSSPARLAFKFNNNGDSILSPWISSNGWQLFDTTFIAGANSTEIEIIGASNLSSCTNIDNISLVKENSVGNVNLNQGMIFKLFPNPVYDYLNFSIKENSEISQISIITGIGKVVKTLPIISNELYPIDFSQLPIGIYIVEIQFKNQKNEFIKILKSQ